MQDVHKQMHRCLEKYPAGSRLRLSTDYPGEPDRIVDGVKELDGVVYVTFRDGGRVCAEREELIQNIE